VKARTALAAVTVLLVVFAALTPIGRARPPRKILQWGWDEPDTAYLRRHLAEMERSPFDGCVFGVRYGPDGRGGSFTWGLWGRRRFRHEELSAAFDDLRALRPVRFRELFLRVNVTPGDVGWFEDFSPILSNLRLAAELARAGRARGILLDVEQYQSQVFELAAQPFPSAYGWDAYADQVRRRGREAMAALQEGHPGLTVFLTFGHSLPFVLSDGGRRPLAETHYGLLAPFLDGLVEAARGGTRIVDGYELSYGFREPAQFAEARHLVRESVLSIVGPRKAYRQRVRLAFGLWLDYDWRRYGWSATDPERNHFTPEGFERSLCSALQETDQYVWVYNETPRWWSTPGGANPVPAPYVTALRRVRRLAAPAQFLAIASKAGNRRAAKR
jgi:hypothetical protein